MPCACEIRAPGMKVAIENRPSVTIDGRIEDLELAAQVRRAGGDLVGLRVAVVGGRHFTTFVMNTSSRRQPIDAEQLDQEVAGPADERPALRGPR